MITQRLHRIFYDTSTDWSELWTGFLCFAWAVSLFNPFADTFASPALGLMRALCHAQWPWGLIFLGVGAAQTCGVIWKLEWWRQRGAFVAASLCLFMSILFFSAGAILGGTLYAVHAVSAARTYLNRARRERTREVD